MSIHPHLDPEPQDALAHLLTRALQTPPRFAIPADFAARVAASASRLPAPAPAKSRVPWTTLAIRAAFAVLALAMLALPAWARNAPNTQQLLLLGTEIALALEFVALTTWFSLRPPSIR